MTLLSPGDSPVEVAAGERVELLAPDGGENYVAAAPKFCPACGAQYVRSPGGCHSNTVHVWTDGQTLFTSCPGDRGTHFGICGRVEI